MDAGGKTDFSVSIHRYFHISRVHLAAKADAGDCEQLELLQTGRGHIEGQRFTMATMAKPGRRTVDS